MAKITRAVAEQRLGDVPQDRQFWCSDGRILKNLPELRVALEQMTDETFRYHSNDAKNDFSNWVRDVIGDDELAADLRKSNVRVQAAKIVADRVGWLRRR